MRALRSPAISDRASVLKVRRKLSLNPRTPTSAATPTATDRTTNPNLPGADFRSRQPMAPARFQLNARLAILRLLRHCGLDDERQCVFNDHAVAKHDFAIGAAGNLGVVSDQNQCGAGALVALEEQVEH